MSRGWDSLQGHRFKMDFPIFGPMHGPVIHSYSQECMGGHLAYIGANQGTTASATANRAWYFPFRITSPFLASSMYVANNGTGNVDLGIYSGSGRKLASTGSQALSGADINNFSLSAPILLDRGRYFMALATSTTTSLLSLVATGFEARQLSASGIMMQATAFPLPATATFAAASVDTQVFLFGIAQPGAI